MFSENKDVLLCNHNYQSQGINNDTIPQSNQPTYSNFARGLKERVRIGKEID